MLKQAAYTLNPYEITEAARAASRQVWLASLGAAVVTRDWVQSEARPIFKRMVREGTAIESRAIRFVGDQVENSMERANTAWKRTRRTVESTVRQAADTVVTYAQQVYPKALPIELPDILVKVEKAAKKAAPKKRTVAKQKKVVRARTTQAARKVKRAVKKAAKAAA